MKGLPVPLVLNVIGPASSIDHWRIGLLEGRGERGGGGKSPRDGHSAGVVRGLCRS